MYMERALSWQPIHKAIKQVAEDGDRLSWIVVPFIKLDALKRLLDSVGGGGELIVISRWRVSDFTAGVSDLDVFPYLHSKGVKLYANTSLHMKLYVFNSNKAINTSGNLTLKGLGYSESCNIEVANCVQLLEGDWLKLHLVQRDSRLITMDVYNRFKALLDQLPIQPSPAAIDVENLFESRKEFTLSELPATDNPVDLIDFYFDRKEDFKYDPEFLRRVYHDFSIYGISEGALTRVELVEKLRTNFCNSQFVLDFLIHLQQQESIRFGGVADWIHAKCDDVPLPYRWEVKDSTRCFYNWLQYFVENVSWDRPNHSQIIRWNS
jgi:hypothetical protein